MTSAERSKRYHSRRRAGVIVLPVPVDEFGFIDALLEDGRITDAASEDRQAVVAAAAHILSDYIKKVATRRVANTGARGSFIESKEVT